MADLSNLYPGGEHYLCYPDLKETQPLTSKAMCCADILEEIIQDQKSCHRCIELNLRGIVLEH